MNLEARDDRTRDASLVLLARRIYLDFEPKPRSVEALAIKNGSVVAAGSKQDAWAAVGSDALHCDLGEHVVLPGFIDAHIHLAGYALARRRLRIMADETAEQVLSKVGVAAASRSKGQFIVGRGWDHAGWGSWPTARMLDEVAPNHPVALTRKDGHAVWVNSAAMTLAGIDAHSATPEGGEIVLHDGRPTGILKETAQRLVGSIIPAESAKQRKQALLSAFEALWRHGIVGCHDMGFLGSGGLELHKDLTDLQRDGQLGQRVVWYVLREAFDQALEAGLHVDRGDEWLRLGGLKLFLDGTLGSQTAHMIRPFEGQSDNLGLPTMSEAAFRDWVVRAAGAGLPTAVHAIGDGANRVALDGFAYARSQRASTAPRLLHRIEHAQVLDPQDIPRFAELDIVASMQPVHLRADLDVASRFWGERCAHAYAWRALQDTGAAMAFGSDAPIETASVLEGLRSARLRQNPHGLPEGGWHAEQSMELGPALHAYTAGAAAAAGQRATLGSLTPGKRADLIALDQDPLTSPPESLPELSIDATMLNGHWVFDAIRG